MQDGFNSTKHLDGLRIIAAGAMIIAFGLNIAPLLPTGRLILALAAIVVLAFANVISPGAFEAPLRRHLTEAYDRCASSPAAPRQVGA